MQNETSVNKKKVRGSVNECCYLQALIHTISTFVVADDTLILVTLYSDFLRHRLSYKQKPFQGNVEEEEGLQEFGKPNNTAGSLCLF
jgi:hypothetical protein